MNDLSTPQPPLPIRGQLHRAWDEADRYRKALERIAERGGDFEADGAWSRTTARIARTALETTPGRRGMNERETVIRKREIEGYLKLVEEKVEFALKHGATPDEIRESVQAELGHWAYVGLNA